MGGNLGEFFYPFRRRRRQRLPPSSENCHVLQWNDKKLIAAKGIKGMFSMDPEADKKLSLNGLKRSKMMISTLKKRTT